MSAVRAVIFDLDGTVVDSHRYTFAAFRHAIAPFHPPLTDAEILAAFGPAERTILARVVPAAAVGAAYERLQAFYAAHVDELQVHPDMRQLLEDAREAGLRCGLFTGRGADSTRMILARLGLAGAFAAVIAGDEAQRPKPAPDGVHQLLAALACNAHEAIVVGDSPLDCAAAHAAGAAAVFAAWYDAVGAIAPAGVPVATHPNALRALLGLPPSRAESRGSGDAGR